ncbi:MAG: hypothetical protein ACYDIE_14255, partial [Candidatus Krumholzibacteriia bacterium]
MERGAGSDLRALGLSILAHGLVLLLTWRVDFFPVTREARAAETTQTVDLILEPEPPAAATAAAPPPAVAAAVVPPAATAMPHAYLDVPERLRSPEPPPRADYLALVNSRAADEVAGGRAEDEPTAPIEADVPQVAIKRADPEAGSPPGSVTMPPARPATDARAARAAPAVPPRARPAPPRGAEALAGGGWPLPAGRPETR